MKKFVIPALVAVIMLAVATPTNAGLSFGSKRLEAALDNKLEYVIKDDYDLDLVDTEYECDRMSVRRWECDTAFSATVNFDLFFEDTYGDEVYAREGDTLECETVGIVTRRGFSSLSRNYRIEFEDPECEIVEDEPS